MYGPERIHLLLNEQIVNSLSTFGDTYGLKPWMKLKKRNSIDDKSISKIAKAPVRALKVYREVVERKNFYFQPSISICTVGIYLFIGDAIMNIEYNMYQNTHIVRITYTMQI